MANIYANASDVLKNKKEYLVKKDWFIGKLKYLKCRRWPIYAGLRRWDYQNYRMMDGFAELANRIYCHHGIDPSLTEIQFLERKGHFYLGRTFPGDTNVWDQPPVTLKTHLAAYQTIQACWKKTKGE